MAAVTKTPNRTGKSLHVYLEPALRDAIDKATKHTRHSLTTEVEIALEKHLKELGFWPPPEQD